VLGLTVTRRVRSSTIVGLPPVLVVGDERNISVSRRYTVSASKQVAAAVEKFDSTPFNIPLGKGSYNTEVSLVKALEIIRIIIADMPWYRKVLLSLKFLIGGIEEYLRDKGWDI
jgi:hypothetical protein